MGVEEDKSEDMTTLMKEELDGLIRNKMACIVWNNEREHRRLQRLCIKKNQQQQNREDINKSFGTSPENDLHCHFTDFVYYFQFLRNLVVMNNL